MINRITLLTSTLKDADGNTHASPIDVSGFQEGVFFLEITASVAPTSLDVDIVTYDPYTDDWYVIASFAQQSGNGKAAPITLASYLGQKIAISWEMVGTSFTFSVSGIVKRIS